MGWLFSIGFMIAGCVTGNTEAFICAGLFAIAGAISFGSVRLMEANKAEEKDKNNG